MMIALNGMSFVFIPMTGTCAIRTVKPSSVLSILNGICYVENVAILTSMLCRPSTYSCEIIRPLLQTSFERWEKRDGEKL